MAMEEDEIEKDAAGKGGDSKCYYDAPYFWTSQYVHVTVDAINGHACAVGETFRVRMRLADEKDLGNDALINVAVYTCKIFVRALGSMHINQPKALNDLFSLIRVLAARKRSRSRR